MGSVGRARPWIGLGLIVLVAATLRLIGLARHSFWFDEVVTMSLARQDGPFALLRLLQQADATRAPLHPLILQGWVALFGPSELSGRALSAMFSVASVVVVFGIGRAAFDEATGLWAAWLMAISPAEVHYAQEVRMYAGLVLVSGVCWSLLLGLRRSAPLWKQVGYAAGLIALVYCHPLGGLMLAALGLGYWLDRRHSQLRPAGWLTIHLAVALALSPWVVNYLDHAPDPRSPVPSWCRYLSWPQLFTGGNRWAVVAGGVLIALGLLARTTRYDPPRRSAGAMLLAWLLVPPVLLLAYSQLKHPLFGPIRYLLFVGPAYLLLVARGLVVLPRWPRLAVAAAGAALAFSALPQQVYDPQVKPNWRAAAAVVRQTDPKAPVVLLCAEPHMYFPTLRYYLEPDSALVSAAVMASTLDPAPSDRPEALWSLVDALDGLPAVPEPIVRAYQPVQRWDLGRVRLAYWKSRPPDPSAASEPVPAEEVHH